ncbi:MULTISPECIES: helix-turn-helix domain-containing protein [Mesorhizobium]|uniref:Helix-turn-helix domain-containing protein n=4 Tax=Mesorhizobium TaxID=68287 RepID=A0ABU5AEQ6_9HYPH|nr:MULTISPECIES: helix-turn-helix domain-containing protein [Mesorhizobium]MDX8437220.1 helix-turn-helix domain-containing protein [Mesorhizobium abyssinicae]MDX8449226.1 helix-turn-helix domain-containing protein [Mesorhizobium sp. VK3C]MDX8469973.1 helix-turn-helix domain-containing protein [Mesorhizobium sp. VK23B]MDX8476322.1 helix-turn-helix domain-containing protein [Mesorhizobium sp. VK23A]MDX8495810.1 helix-turn-helix domain-containing protein [Mesorhizobium sp. VK22B]
MFIKQAAELFSEDERKELIDFLAANPKVGDEIPGTGGVRKVRFGAKGKGKRGAARVIYYWYSDDAPIYALLAYGKNEKVDLEPDEAKAVAAFAKAIKAANKEQDMSEMTKFGADLIQAMSEALAHAQGKDVPGIKVHSVDVGVVDAKAIRKKLDLTQDEMATVLGTSPSGYKKWEQGKRQPSGAARTLLRIMKKEPEAVLRALSSEKETTKELHGASH